MDARRVVVEMLPSAGTAMNLTALAQPTEASAKAALDKVRAAIPNIELEQGFVATMPAPERPFQFSEEQRGFDLSETITGDIIDSTETILMRGTVDAKMMERYQEDPSVFGPHVRVFSDPAIEVCMTCIGTPPVGTARDVQTRLDVPALRRARMTGAGVNVAIVDTGINLAYLRGLGLRVRFDSGRSWVPRPGLTPGDLPVGHGTMCAYDSLLAAPNATLLDVAVLLSNRPGGSIMEGLLSDAFLAYTHLVRLMEGPRRPGECRSLVVNNSWGMFHPSWDYPVGHPANYSHNLRHPFNRIVGRLSQAGADILFAAGNCGRECMDGRCAGLAGPIYGANSHPRVISVAGVDVQKQRVGYSTRGPGALSRMKPDVAGYTHFQGSGVYAADGGTSAATPVVTGLVAAFRSRFPFAPGDPLRSPLNIRNILIRTAEDRGSFGFDFEYGWGIANGRRLARIPALSLTAREALPEMEEELFQPIPSEEIAEREELPMPIIAPAREIRAQAPNPVEVAPAWAEKLEARLLRVERMLSELPEALPIAQSVQSALPQSPTTPPLRGNSGREVKS